MKPYALITGASSGIGLELAKIFARHKHNLILVARSSEALNTLKEHLEKSFGIDVFVIAMDLRDPNSAEIAYDTVKEKGIQVDILVNNAGYGVYGKFSETDIVDEWGMVQVNVTTLTLLTKFFLARMIENKRGRILNVASTAAFQPGPLMAVYYATKAYVLSFSEAIAEELEGTGISVTALCPGPTNTNFSKTANIEGSRLFRNAPSSEAVAMYAYKSMIRGKRLAIYGTKNKLMAQAVRLAPRRIVTRIVKKMQQ